MILQDDMSGSAIRKARNLSILTFFHQERELVAFKFEFQYFRAV